MKNSRMTVLFFIFATIPFVLFQNCGNTMIAENSALSSGNENLPLKNKILPLNNINYSFNDQGELENVLYSVETDVFYYETKYRATNSSTMVKISSTDGETKLRVFATNCQENTLTTEQKNDLTDFIDRSLDYVEQKTDDAEEIGCSFPRLVVDSQQEDLTDLDIYYAPSECVLANKLFVSELNSEGQTHRSRAQLITEIKEFFEEQIDLACAN